MKKLQKILFTLLISYAIVIGINVFGNYRYYAAGNDWHFSVYFSLIVTTLGVLGGTFLFEVVFKKYDWLSNPTLKLLWGVLIFACYGMLLMFAAMNSMSLILHMNYGAGSPDYIPNIIYSVLFSVIIGLIMSGRSFLMHLKQRTEENLLMQQQMVQSQYETLKNQVNPHFLFNSLNTLTVMIPEQPQVAVQFVEQMAKVFRYSLQHGTEQTVDVDTELKVVRSYLFLNEQRFDGKLKVKIDISHEALQQRIITQSLLMLVENAIKHNEISTSNPLTLSLYNENDYLAVANTLQRKAIPEESTKMGLDNIKKRYALASDKAVVADERDNLFIVKIPLL